MADLGARAAGLDEAQPGRVGRGVFGGDDLHHVAALEFGAQRHFLVVDARGGHVVADLAVDRIGEVHHGGAARHGHDLALGREHVDGVGEQVHLDVVPELGGIARLVLDVQQRLEPLRAQLLGIVAGLGLVEPMGGHAGLGDDVHFLGADLELDVHARGAHQRGVQRLVAIVLGNGDVVLEAARHGLVHLVQHAQRRVAIDNARQDDAKAVDVRHLGKAQLVLLHAQIERIQRAFTAGKAGLQPRAGELGIDLVLHALDQIAASLARAGDGFFQRGVAPGMQVAEGQVLQLAVGLVQPQAVGDGCVDLQCFRRDAAPLAARHVAHGAHVVGAVGQLDQDHAHIARHGQQHLAEGFRLVLFARVELQLVQLREAVDQLGHVLAEALGEIGLGDAAVFHRIVQQRGHQGRGVELPARAQRRDRDGMGDIGFAAAAPLVAVGLVGEGIGFAHLLDAGGIQVSQVLHQSGKGIGRHGGCLLCRHALGPGWRYGIRGGCERSQGRFHDLNVACMLVCAGFM
ncbi:MAG: hypothetical protein GAK34_03660 [Delftia tsuruhatensis]|nr:MAG: hypothetical protein GAK34_03660 [Delftia tsuruhatensis]